VWSICLQAGALDDNLLPWRGVDDSAAGANASDAGDDAPFLGHRVVVHPKTPDLLKPVAPGWVFVGPWAAPR
jgi:hypothetical protein